MGGRRKGCLGQRLEERRARAIRGGGSGVGECSVGKSLGSQPRSSRRNEKGRTFFLARSARFHERGRREKKKEPWGARESDRVFARFGTDFWARRAVAWLRTCRNLPDVNTCADLVENTVAPASFFHQSHSSETRRSCLSFTLANVISCQCSRQGLIVDLIDYMTGLQK